MEKETKQQPHNSKIKKNVIKHVFRRNISENTCGCPKHTISLHRDFFIVLDLRLTKIGSKALLPFAFYRGHINEFGFVHKSIYNQEAIQGIYRNSLFLLRRFLLLVMLLIRHFRFFEINIIIMVFCRDGISSEFGRGEIMIGCVIV